MDKYWGKYTALLCIYKINLVVSPWIHMGGNYSLLLWIYKIPKVIAPWTHKEVTVVCCYQDTSAYITIDTYGVIIACCYGLTSRYIR